MLILAGLLLAVIVGWILLSPIILPRPLARLGARARCPKPIPAPYRTSATPTTAAAIPGERCGSGR